MLSCPLALIVLVWNLKLQTKSAHMPHPWNILFHVSSFTSPPGAGINLFLLGPLRAGHSMLLIPNTAIVVNCCPLLSHRLDLNFWRSGPCPVSLFFVAKDNCSVQKWMNEVGNLLPFSAPVPQMQCQVGFFQLVWWAVLLWEMGNPCFPSPQEQSGWNENAAGSGITNKKNVNLWHLISERETCRMGPAACFLSFTRSACCLDWQHFIWNVRRWNHLMCLGHCLSRLLHMEIKPFFPF